MPPRFREVWFATHKSPVQIRVLTDITEKNNGIRSPQKFNVSSANFERIGLHGWEHSRILIPNNNSTTTPIKTDNHCPQAWSLDSFLLIAFATPQPLAPSQKLSVFMGIMRKPSPNIPAAPRLCRPTLPTKKALEAQKMKVVSIQCRAGSVGEYVVLPQTQDSIAENDDSPRMTANLVSEASSDDERKPISATTRSISPVSVEVNSGRALKLLAPQPAPMTRTGVYFQNVEVRRDVHPLQSCRTQDASSPLQVRRVATSMHGRPLSAAPLLPSRGQTCLRPLIFMSVNKAKRPLPSNETKGIRTKRQCYNPSESQAPRNFETRQDAPETSRSAQVKEASIMVEAAVALANLHSSKRS